MVWGNWVYPGVVGGQARLCTAGGSLLGVSCLPADAAATFHTVVHQDVGLACPALLQEMLKDARSANADMDDDVMCSNRQVARLRHSLEESQAALKAAQAALAQVRLRVMAVLCGLAPNQRHRMGEPPWGVLSVMLRSTSAARRRNGQQRVTSDRRQRLDVVRSGLLGRLGSCRRRWIRSRSSLPPCRWVVLAVGRVRGGVSLAVMAG